MDTEQFQVHASVEDVHWWFVARRSIMRQILGEVVTPSRDHLVVDVGCGTGANLGALAPDYRCLGIDPSEEAIAESRRRFPDVEFICGRAPDDLGDLAGEADAFLLMDVLEHLPDDMEFLQRLVRAASPTAILFVTVPAGPELWSPHDDAFGHYRRYTYRSFTEMCRRAGARPEFVSYFNSLMYLPVRATRRLTQARGRAWGQGGTDFSVPWAPINSALENVFEFESQLLLRRYRNGRGSAFPAGVSLLAVLRPEPGAELQG